MKKSTLIMILSLVLAVALGVGGTLAYLTDDDGDVNVMTVGNVQITQNEQQRVDQGEENSKLEEFEQNKAMAPIVDKGMVRIPQNVNGWDITMRDEDTYRNYVDKIVTVTNTGSSDAYVRTLLAFPTKGYDSGELAFDEWLHWNYISDTDTTPNNGWMWGTEENGIEYPNNTKDWNAFYNVEINGEEYTVYIATNVDALAPGKTTAPTLVGMFLDAAVDNELVDGKINYYVTKNGKKFDLGDISKLEVLVLSQAVQADGFDTAWEAFDAAFPTDKEAVVEWLGNIEPGTPGEKWPENNPPVPVVEVSNAQELKEALAADEEIINVKLTADTMYDVAAWQNNAIGGESTERIIIDGNGYTLDFNQTNSDWNNIVTDNNATLTLKNMKVTNSGYNNGPWNRHDLNFACDVELISVTSDKAMAFKAGASLKNVTINDANNSDTYAIWIQPKGQTVTLDNVTIDMLACSDGRGLKIDNQYVAAADEAKVTLNVSNTTFKTEEKSAILVKSTVGADITLSNVDISGVAADSTNPVWVDGDASAYADLVTVTGGSAIVEP